MLLKKYYVLILQKLDIGSAISIRLVKLTGKHSSAIHPKHLIKTSIWYQKYLKKSDKVLDIGCGVGKDAVIISQKVKEVVATDIDLKSLSIARKLISEKNIVNVKTQKVDSNKRLPFKNNYFDKVVCSDVLEHLKRRKFALSEIRRVLKKGGKLFLVVDNPETSWKKMQKSVNLFYYADKDHKYEYPKQEILSTLENTKFDIESVATITYDTPLRGLIDFTGGLSISIYKKLRKIRDKMLEAKPQETVGYRIVTKKI